MWKCAADAPEQAALLDGSREVLCGPGQSLHFLLVRPLLLKPPHVHVFRGDGGRGCCERAHPFCQHALLALLVLHRGCLHISLLPDAQPCLLPLLLLLLLLAVAVGMRSSSRGRGWGHAVVGMRSSLCASGGGIKGN